MLLAKVKEDGEFDVFRDPADIDKEYNERYFDFGKPEEIKYDECVK